MANSLLLDNHQISLDLPQNVCLAVFISLLERVLFKRNKRIVNIWGDGKNIFNAKNFHKPWSVFKKIECQSEQICNHLKKAVITLSIGNKFHEMSAVSHPTMRFYADKIGADFIVINKEKIMGSHPCYEKWQLFDLLFEYDRIIYLDTDILVVPNCPDLFDIVPIDKIGGFVESNYSNRMPWIEVIQDMLGAVGWREEYLNSGVGVYSYIHRPIFKKPTRYVYDPVFYDQTLYNYHIKQLRFLVYSIPMEFNRMDICGTDRLSGFIIHYAGRGYTSRKLNDPDLYSAKIALMKKDVEVLK